MSRKILRRLKFDNDTIHRVMALVRAHDDRPPLQAEVFAGQSTGTVQDSIRNCLR